MKRMNGMNIAWGGLFLVASACVTSVDEDNVGQTEQALVVCDGPEDIGLACATGKVCTASSQCVNPATCNASASGPGVVQGNVTVDGNDTAGDLAPLASAWCVTGTLTVTGTALTNLSGLSTLLTVGNSLTVQSNAQLTSLTGLQALTRSVSIKIVANMGLSNLQGLSGVKTLSSLEVVGNNGLTTLDGLAPVDIVSSVNLTGNGHLVEVDALSGIQGKMSGYLTIQNEASITDLSGLSNVTEVGGALRVFNADALTDLTGLNGIWRAGGELLVAQNQLLPDLDSLSGLLQVGSARIQYNPALDVCAVEELLARTGASGATSTNNLACSAGGECASAACEQGACTAQVSALGEVCSTGICDGEGACGTAGRLAISLISDGSIYNPPSTHDGVFNPGDRITLNARLSNLGPTPLTAISSVRIVSSDEYVRSPWPYPIYGNQVAPGATGNAFPRLIIANDAPEGHVIPITVAVDYTENGHPATAETEVEIPVGPGLSDPGVPAVLDLVRIIDGYYTNTVNGHFEPGERILADVRARSFSPDDFVLNSAWTEISDPYVTVPWTTGSHVVENMSVDYLSFGFDLSPDTPVGHTVSAVLHYQITVDSEAYDATLPVSFVVTAP